MKAKVTEESCDNPECSYSEIVEGGKHGEPATGYHFGRGFWVMGGGGPIPAFYAHEEACIVPAMNAAIERAS